MAEYRNFKIETTIVPDAAGQYEATFVVQALRNGKAQGGKDGEKQEGDREVMPRGNAEGGRYAFPPVGSYMTPDDAREQAEAWARRWIDANFGEQGK
ncbi:hypothetical protein [Bordetella bronchialis]|uniref:Uncharacterized protein n=1 Tax=Bordetella bronchialis TaxID=463025 RepID=A0A193FFZ1_9BORD|nr:hypothetical protein [Bordetella bronchialis]ANN66024.1 hypothetical protein BAU06_06690 [Bordetella bronchialis]ANN71108.1 hypothetical protein BAU08_06945 [Bordetella bronchialis]